MKQKKIIITGASSGIGEATAQMILKAGHKVLLVSRNREKLESISSKYKNATVCLADVSDYVLFREKLSGHVELWGKPDVLINNAGVGYFEQIAKGNIAQWHQMIDTNVKGLLNGIHICMPWLLETKGHIINIGSVASHQVFPNCGVYCATKHAVWAISESLRIELAGKIRITTISPGSVNTPFIDKTTDPDMLREYKDYFASAMPPSAVAEQIMHVINSASEWVINEVIVRPNRAVK